MKKLNRATIAIITALIVSRTQAEQRTWTDTYGNTVEAELVDNHNGVVTLMNAAGKEAQLSISELSAGDQKYVLVNTPPKISIKVNKVTNRQNQGFSFENPNNSDYDRDVQVQTTSRSFRVTLEKGSIPYNKPITAEIYVVGFRKAAEQFVLLSKTVKPVDFDQPDSKNKFSFVSEESKTKTLQGGRDAGVEFHGYLVVLVDDKGRVFETRASRSRMEQHAALIRKAEIGKGVTRERIEQVIKEEKQKAQ
jgi:hypothetical protein